MASFLDTHLNPSNPYPAGYKPLQSQPATPAVPAETPSTTPMTPGRAWQEAGPRFQPGELKRPEPVQNASLLAAPPPTLAAAPAAPAPPGAVQRPVAPDVSLLPNPMNPYPTGYTPLSGGGPVPDTPASPNNAPWLNAPRAAVGDLAQGAYNALQPPDVVKNLVAAPFRAAGYAGAQVGDAALNATAGAMGRTRTDPSGWTNAMAPGVDASIHAMGAPVRAISGFANAAADAAGWGYAPGQDPFANKTSGVSTTAGRPGVPAATQEVADGAPPGHPQAHVAAEPAARPLPGPGQTPASGEGWVKIGNQMYQIQGSNVSKNGKLLEGGGVAGVAAAAPALGGAAGGVAGPAMVRPSLGYVPGAGHSGMVGAPGQPGVAGLSGGVSAALEAAAARGDWESIRKHYQAPEGGTYMGRTREQEAPDLSTPAARRAFAAQQKQLESTRAGKESDARIGREGTAEARAGRETDARIAEGQARTEVAMDANQRANFDAQIKAAKQDALVKLSTNNYKPEEKAGLRMMAGLSENYKVTSDKGDPLNGIAPQTYLTDTETGWTKNLTTGEVTEPGKETAKGPTKSGALKTMSRADFNEFVKGNPGMSPAQAKAIIEKRGIKVE